MGVLPRKILKTKKAGKAISGHFVGAIFFLVVLILNVPSTIFQLYREGSSWVEPVLSLGSMFLLKDTTQ